ncbi:hypothetical protein U5903_06880 [Cereibacter johrii]|nr:hypothetical protein [Cereibacter johrii]MEA5160498.1 hypothetical protein [Cereibacter johrii]
MAAVAAAAGAPGPAVAGRAAARVGRPAAHACARGAGGAGLPSLARKSARTRASGAGAAGPRAGAGGRPRRSAGDGPGRVRGRPGRSAGGGGGARAGAAPDRGQCLRGRAAAGREPLDNSSPDPPDGYDTLKRRAFGATLHADA